MAGIAQTKSEKSKDWDQMFQKGDMYVIPNPPLEYSSENPNLKFYFETYNSQNKKLQYQVSILDGAKREAFKTFLPVWDEAKDHGRILSVPLDFLPTGVYYLKLDLVDNSIPPVKYDEANKKFYFFNQFLAPQLTANFTEDQLFEMSEFATMNLDKANFEFRKARIIGGSVEINQWEKLKELQGKQRFLYRFWAMRDEDTTTILNEFKAEFDDRVEFANTYFSYGKNKDGWNTDRGRILLKYGNPTQIDRIPQSGTDRPYETWTYDEIQGGVVFNFVDVMGYGNFILVNSNALGEIKNQRWFQDYVQNQKSGQQEMEDKFR
jgi:GWxTD domain-containing protein